MEDLAKYPKGSALSFYSLLFSLCSNEKWKSLRDFFIEAKSPNYRHTGSLGNFIE
jgi:hypothetical protein